MTRFDPIRRWPAVPAPHDRRRGVALIAFVTAVLVIGVFVLWLARLGATASSTYLGQYLSAGALYASESGLEWALRELQAGSDLDGDGVAGTISNDGNDANNPALASGSFRVQAAGQTYTARGVWQSHERVTEATLQ